MRAAMKTSSDLAFESEPDDFNVFDIETENWDRFVVGGLLIGKEYREFWWDRENDMVDAILAHRGTLWAHNGGCYDMLWLLEHTRARRVPSSLILAGQRIICTRIGGLYLRDSYAICPLALSRTGKKDTLHLWCECRTNCGGYCIIRRSLHPSDRRRRDISLYLETDCKATRRLLRDIQDISYRNGIVLRKTIGGSAIATATAWCGLEPEPWRRKKHGDYRDHDFARAGYYGGRVEVFRTGSYTVNGYDLNSAYPAALAQLALPVGERFYAEGAQASKAFAAGKEGIYEAEVSIVRDCWIPPLPLRIKNHVGYFVGSVRGVWAGNELRRIAHGIGNLSRISRGVYWEKIAVIFKEFINKVFELRSRLGVGTFFGQWLKLFANSLTGKFAQRDEHESVYFGAQKGSEDVPLDKAQTIWCCRRRYLSECARPHWAAYLTAHTRIALGRALGTAGDAVYCDTDGIKVLGERESGTGLGEWKYEGTLRDFRAPGLKVYAGFDADTGEVVARAKGVADAVRNFEKLSAGVVMERGVWALRTAATKDRLFSRKRIVRHVLPSTHHIGSRLLTKGGLTMPVTLEEFLTWKR